MMAAALGMLVVLGTGAELRLSPPAAGAPAWTFSNGGEFPGAEGSLELDAEGLVHLRYDFTGGGAYVAGYLPLADLPPVRAWRLRVKKPAEATLSIRMTDGTGQTFQKSLAYEGAGWQEVEVGYGHWSVHWGGAMDGVFHPPLRQIGLCIDSQGLQDLVGEVLIGEVTALPGEPAEAPAEAFRGRYQVTDFGPDSGFSGSLLDSIWHVDFAGTERAVLGHSLSLFGSPKELRLTVRGGPPGAVVTMQFGSHFQTFSRRLGALQDDITTFVVSAPPEGWEHSGGENDGVVRLPLRLANLSIERGTAPAAAAAIELVDLTCVTEMPADRTVTLTASLTDGGVADGRRRLLAECRGWNVTPEPVSGTLRCTYHNWDEELLAEHTQAWTLPGDGLRAVATVAAEIPAGVRFADATFSFEADGLRPSPATAGYTRGPDDAGDPALTPESPWGMGVYLYRNANNEAGYGSMDRVAALARAAGVKWSREEFQWHRIETAPGVFDYSFYDQLVETAQRHGISVYALLAYWNPGYESYTEAGIDAYCDWARQLVRRYKDRIHHWEIYNEPNIFFWSGPKELYPVMLERAYAAIKAEDPTAEVLGCSTAGIDRAFIANVLEAGAPFDALTIHPYRGRLIERQFEGELQRVAEQVDGRPVWITEMGWPTQIGGTSEREQAELLARCYLTAVGSGVVRSMSWYDFRSDGWDPFYNEHNFGVVRPDLTPKPAYRALATVCRTLAGSELRKPEGLPDGVLGLGNGTSVGLWCPSQTIDLTVTLDGDGTACNLMGDPISAGRGSLTLRLTRGKPVFVTGRVVGYGPVRVIEPDEAPGRLVI